MENKVDENNIKDVLNNIDFSEVISKVTSNSEDVANLAAQSAGHITPSMMEQARKHANGEQGKKIKEEVVRQGLCNRATLENMKEQKKLYDQANIKAKGVAQKTILITSSKQIKIKEIHPKNSDKLKEEIGGILKTNNPTELLCSRLSKGPLENKTIKVWYDAKCKGNNKRATKIIGFQIAGDLLIMIDNEDLSEQNFREVEKLL